MNDKQAAKEWARDILYQGDWAIVDTETTGLYETAEICQIAVLTSDDADGWQEFAQPILPISREASNIHGITEKDIECERYFDEVFLDVLRKVKGKDIIFFNADFDLRLIRQSLKARGIQIAFPTSDRRKGRIFTNGGTIHCAMLWYSQFVGEWNGYHGNYRWQKLPGGDHSALGDCKATLKVIQKMAEDENG